LAEAGMLRGPACDSLVRGVDPSAEKRGVWRAGISWLLRCTRPVL